MLGRILDRLEEWIIATLIAAATLLTFVAVVHRYGSSNAVVLSVWAKAHGLPWLALAANSIYVNLAAINLSWAMMEGRYLLAESPNQEYVDLEITVVRDADYRWVRRS